MGRVELFGDFPVTKRTILVRNNRHGVHTPCHKSDLDHVNFLEDFLNQEVHMIDAPMSHETTTDLIVIGAGLAGLTAAASASKLGKSVRLLEKSSRVGGRAGTTVRDGISLNLGPHALYREGTAFHVLRQLGVPFKGAEPVQGKSQLLLGGKFFPWPQRTVSWLMSPLFTWRKKRGGRAWSSRPSRS